MRRRYARQEAMLFGVVHGTSSPRATYYYPLPNTTRLKLGLQVPAIVAHSRMTSYHAKQQQHRGVRWLTSCGVGVASWCLKSLNKMIIISGMQQTCMLAPQGPAWNLEHSLL